MNLLISLLLLSISLVLGHLQVVDMLQESFNVLSIPIPIQVQVRVGIQLFIYP